MITVVQIARLESTAAAASYIPLLLSNTTPPYTSHLIVSRRHANSKWLSFCLGGGVLNFLVCSIVVVFFSNKEDKWVFAVQFEKKDGNIW